VHFSSDSAGCGLKSDLPKGLLLQGPLARNPPKPCGSRDSVKTGYDLVNN
jgi:hypothetical protein